jgi:hypothetical protein
MYTIHAAAQLCWEHIARHPTTMFVRRKYARMQITLHQESAQVGVLLQPLHQCTNVAYVSCNQQQHAASFRTPYPYEATTCFLGVAASHCRIHVLLFLVDLCSPCKPLVRRWGPQQVCKVCRQWILEGIESIARCVETMEVAKTLRRTHKLL